TVAATTDTVAGSYAVNARNISLMSRTSEGVPGYSNITLCALGSTLRGSDSSICLTTAGRIDLHADNSMVTMSNGALAIIQGGVPLSPKIKMVGRPFTESPVMTFSIGISQIDLKEKSIELNVADMLEV